MASEETVQDLDGEILRLQAERAKKDKGLATFGGTGEFDRDLYGGSDRSEYRTSIAVSEEAQEAEELEEQKSKLRTFTAPIQFLNETIQNDSSSDDVFNQKAKSIAKFLISPFLFHILSHLLFFYSREDEYRKRRLKRSLSPDRADMFDAKTPAADSRTYKDALVDAKLEREEAVVRAQIEKKMKEEEKIKEKEERKRRRKWDAAGADDSLVKNEKEKTSDWDREEATPISSSRWDDPQTPVSTPRSTSRWDEPTPVKKKRRRWDETPTATPGTPTPTQVQWDSTQKKIADGETPKRSRWDETPAAAAGLTPGATPLGDFGLLTPGTIYHPAMTPEQVHALRWEREVDERNRPYTDDELDAMIPPGFKIVNPPSSYVPIRTQARKLTSTPTPLVTGLFFFVF